MKTTMKIKKTLAFILTMIMFMSITINTFAAELPQENICETDENDEQIEPRASHSVRFTYPATKEVYLSNNFKYFEYTTKAVGIGKIKVTFESSKKNYTFILEPNSSGQSIENIESGRYTIKVEFTGVVTSIDFFLWS